MARGWESKAVESQIEERERSGARPHRPLSPEQQQAAAQMQTLELARRRIIHELDATRSGVRRQALESALSDVNAQIDRLARTSTPPPRSSR